MLRRRLKEAGDKRKGKEKGRPARPLKTTVASHFPALLFQVTLLEAYETSKMCFLKFDTLPGTDVLTYLAEKTSYSEQMVAEVAAQVVDGLAYIHWRGKVYLNLEPGNIIVCSGRSLGKTVQVKLVNFETTQTVAKTGTQIKGSYNFDYAGKDWWTALPLCYKV